MEWDWPESGIRRNTQTVQSRIYWSYAVLSVTRQVMKDGAEVVAPLGRSRAFVGEYGRMMRGEKRMGALDREAGLLALHTPLCAHCGVHGVEMDHLIPRAREGANLGFNTVPSCMRCNRSRGKLDLMRWYQRQRGFPSLALLRHYLKRFAFHLKQGPSHNALKSMISGSDM